MEHVKTAAAVLRLPEPAADTPVGEIHVISRNSGDCPFCKGTGFRRLENGVQQCECLRRRKLERRIAELPERFRMATFDSYAPVDTKQCLAKNTMAADPSRSFFLHGDYARGKTHLAIAQYRALVESGQSVAWRSMGELLSELTAASVRDETSLVIQNIRHADSFHLFVDDLDKFKSTEFKHEVLFELFDLIYRRKLGVTLTSNYGLRALVEAERVHPAIVRRIDDMCLALEV